MDTITAQAARDRYNRLHVEPTELEQKAWQYFTASCQVSPAESFVEAQKWLDERDARREGKSALDAGWRMSLDGATYIKGQMTVLRAENGLWYVSSSAGRSFTAPLTSDRLRFNSAQEAMDYADLVEGGRNK